jgi:hypothetical protein
MLLGWEQGSVRQECSGINQGSWDGLYVGDRTQSKDGEWSSGSEEGVPIKEEKRSKF